MRSQKYLISVRHCWDTGAFVSIFMLNPVTKLAFFHIVYMTKRICLKLAHLDRPTVEKLVNATITSRLDYCNSLMFGIPKDLMSQLQKRQNHAARVITQWRKYDHITPVLVDLHWLPVKQRIDFKILLLTYKALNGLAPAYIRELLTPYIPARTLRSMDNNLLEPPKCRLEYFGKRSFAAAAPVLWNDLPLHIKQSPSVDIFKSRIKTRLFQLAYFIWLCKCMYVYFMLSIMNRLGLTRSYVTCTYIRFSACEQGPNIHMAYLSHFETSAL